MQIIGRRRSGQAIILLAVFAFTLIVFLGLAIDSGMLYLGRRHLQNAVDAACLAAATHIARGEPGHPYDTAVAYLNNNLDANAPLAFDRGSLHPDIRPQPTDPMTSTVRVVAAIRANSYFMRIVNVESYNVMARARCGATGGGGLTPIAVNRFPGYTNNSTCDINTSRRVCKADMTRELLQYYRRNRAL